MDIGSKIKNIRKERSLTQEEFARQFHVTRQTVSNWENNKNYPDMETLRQISDAFSLSFDTLLKEDKDFLKQIDQTGRSAGRRKQIILAMAVFLCILTVSIIVFLARTPRATADGNRINTDTDIRMLVDLPGEAPSRAITYTMRKNRDSEKEAKNIASRILAASGKRNQKYNWDSVDETRTDDIPTIYAEEATPIALYFQDTLYQNQTPSQVTDITVTLLDTYGTYGANEASISPEWTLQDGRITFPLKASIPAPSEGIDNSPYRLAIVAEYIIKENTYTSVTVLNLDKHR